MTKSAHLVLVGLVLATLSCGDSTSLPISPPPPRQILNLTTTGWQTHIVKHGDGQGGWIDIPAEYQLVTINSGAISYGPFGVGLMDNGEIILLGASYFGTAEPGELPVAAFSKDGGQTWSGFNYLDNNGDAQGRPTMLTLLGKGSLSFVAYHYPVGYASLFSGDYGRTWPEYVGMPAASNGKPFYVEGNPLVERDANGTVTGVAQIGYNNPTGWPREPATGILRWSYDGGRTWTNETIPPEWYRDESYEGETYRRGVNEGSLARAANGWLVAALRTDMPARFISIANDNLEGVGVSISKDNGQTWSPVNIIYGAGRMHTNVLRLPNGDLVLTHILRQDIPNGAMDVATYNRGCEALVSHDNGETWDVSRRYVLHHFEYTDGSRFTLASGHLYSALLDDGSIITVYGDYIHRGGGVIRWKPN